MKPITSVNQLVEFGVVDSSSLYFDKYCEVVSSKDSQNKEETKLEKHHVVPKSFYKMFNLKVDNTKNNIVYLSRVEHIKAHYYLSLCSTGKFKASNAYAVVCLTRTSSFKEASKLIEAEGLEEIQNLFEFHYHNVSKNRQGSVHTEASRKRLSETCLREGTHKGKNNGMYGKHRTSPTKG